MAQLQSQVSIEVFRNTFTRVDIVGIFTLFIIENKGEIDMSGVIFIQHTFDKYKFALEFIGLATVCKLCNR